MKERDILVVLSIGATSRTAGGSYVLRLKSKADPKVLVKSVSNAIRNADYPQAKLAVSTTPKIPEDPEKAKAKLARAAQKAIKEAKKADRAQRREARATAKRRKEFERDVKRREREEKKAAIAARREIREWLNGTPEKGDTVMYQEKPKGYWRTGRVVGIANAVEDAIDVRYKVVGERGTHYYPAAQVKRTTKSQRG